MELKVESGDPWRGSTCRGRAMRNLKGWKGGRKESGRTRWNFWGVTRRKVPVERSGGE